MSRKQWAFWIAMLWAAVLISVALVALGQSGESVTIQAQGVQSQLIHHGPVTQTTRYVGGSFYGIEHRYVAMKFGWNDTTTSTITVTVWLQDPVGNQCCSQTVTATLGTVSNTYTTDALTMTGQYWPRLVGTVENITGTVTPTLDIILHGQ